MANVLTPAGGIFRRPRGGRPQVIIGQVDHRHISIHALREEGDTFLPTPSQSMSVFLSTPSVRRATGSGFAANGGDDISIHTLREESDKVSARVGFLHIDFYPRPPRGGRRECIVDIDSTTEISIHALREEGDVSGPVLVSTS